MGNLFRCQPQLCQGPFQLVPVEKQRRPQDAEGGPRRRCHRGQGPEDVHCPLILGGQGERIGADVGSIPHPLPSLVGEVVFFHAVQVAGVYLPDLHAAQVIGYITEDHGQKGGGGDIDHQGLPKGEIAPPAF